MNPEHWLTAARATIVQVKFCWAITLAPDGIPSARVIQPMPLADDWSVRFLTRRDGRKVAEIQRAGHLTLGYQHDPEFAYVTLTGRPRVLDDVAYKRRIWSPVSERYYHNGPDDPNVAVVHLDTHRIEMWSSVRKVAPEPYALSAAVLERDGSGWRASQT